MSKLMSLGNLPREEFKKYKNKNFNFLKDNLFFRNIQYKNISILKMVSFLVRDKNWNNHLPRLLSSKEQFNKNTIKTNQNLVFEASKQIVKVNNEFILQDDKISFISKGKFETDFLTNRIGFNLLLPLAGVVGKKVSVLKFDNNLKKTLFPRLIKPDQPFSKFKKLSFVIDNEINIEIKFKGNFFEMEDQRNWGDSSFKIYSGSLLDPFPYKILSNTKFYQQIDIQCSSKKIISFKSNNKKIIKLKNLTNFKMPSIGVKVDLTKNSPYLKNLNFDFFYFIKDFVKNDKKLFPKIYIKSTYLVALIDHNKNINTIIFEIKEYVQKNKINLSYLLICPKIYLNSFQPAGQWPNVYKLEDYYKAAKKQFKKTKIIAGMVTNFTELNRKRPQNNFDILNFSLTPIVHDASDYGVMDTPENIHYILNTVNKFSNSKPLHIGPITLGMHFNPYGENLAINNKNNRVEMAEFDPRHDSLIGICWSVAILTQIINKNVNHLTFDSLIGPHGILTKMGNKRPLYFFNEILIFFKNAKIYHISDIKPIYGIFFSKNKKKYFLLCNTSNIKQEAQLIRFKYIKQAYLNSKNFSLIKKNNFSFFKFFSTNKDLLFESYEVKLLEVKQ